MNSVLPITNTYMHTQDFPTAQPHQISPPELLAQILLLTHMCGVQGITCKTDHTSQPQTHHQLMRNNCELCTAFHNHPVLTDSCCRGWLSGKAPDSLTGPPCPGPLSHVMVSVRQVDGRGQLKSGVCWDWFGAAYLTEMTRLSPRI